MLLWILISSNFFIKKWSLSPSLQMEEIEKEAFNEKDHN